MISKDPMLDALSGISALLGAVARMSPEDRASCRRSAALQEEWLHRPRLTGRQKRQLKREGIESNGQRHKNTMG